MTSGGDDRLVEVALLRLPVPLWAKAQEVTQELLREFALAAVGMQVDEQHLPTRLTQLMETLTTRFAGVSSVQEQQLLDAHAAGVAELDLAFTVPVAVGAASRELGDMLDEADRYCRDGQHLLTLAAPDDVVRFRRWYLWSFITQVGGAAPVPWPAYDGSWAS